jgi:mannose-6-phosphate isomerase-like protein (cupin superfamily)
MANNKTFNKDVIGLAEKTKISARCCSRPSCRSSFLMSIEPGDDIGEETHDGIDQVLSFVSGTGEAIIEGESSRVNPGSIVVVPAGTKHNFINKGNEPMKLYTVYAPPDHKDGTIHRTKEDARKTRTNSTTNDRKARTILTNAASTRALCKRSSRIPKQRLM